MKFFTLFFICVTPFALQAKDTAMIDVGGESLITYQVAPMENPLGNDKDSAEKFKGSNFIHPLKTPSGFSVTCIQPDDHLHHFGLWWPWKHVQIGDRLINCWELQTGEGIVEAKSHQSIKGGLVVFSEYIDRQHPDGPQVILKEKTRVRARELKDKSVKGYLMDLEISQKTAINEPLVISAYRYSGFSIRATEFWNKNNSSILTSEGKDRYSANFSNARWVLVQGKTDKGGDAGILFLSSPDNQSHPEKLRTWDTQHEGAVFINFNTVGDESWTYQPGKSYVRKYRLLVFDGALTPARAESYWQTYSKRVSR